MIMHTRNSIYLSNKYMGNIPGLIKKQQGGIVTKKTGLEGLMEDQQYKNNFDLKLNLDNLVIANDSLINRGANRAQSCCSQ